MCTLFFVLFLSLLALSLAREGNSRFHAAKCIALGRRCNDYLERQSGSCTAGTRAREQPQACYDLACSWCVLPGKPGMFPCNRGIVRRMCRMKKKKMPKASPKPSKSQKAMPMTPDPKPDGCIYKGSNRATISLASVPGIDGWTSVSRGGMDGLVFRAGGGGGTVPGGSHGEYCFDVSMEEAGEYYLTMLSAAPHPTDNNDCWLSSSLGFRLLREGVFDSAAKDTWLKAYQNKGGLQINKVISTIDHNPHAFIVPGVQARVPFKICMSGRSFGFEVFKLALLKCSGTDCTPGKMNSMLGALTPTQCS